MSDVKRSATAAQNKASDPFKSAFVSANAGSGKTRVLTQRIARLLLRDVDPARILCLTFTKAAAGEVQNRVFSMLEEWVLLDDDALASNLSNAGEPVESYSKDKLTKARRLFAQAMDTLGGLKVQTIHAFSSSVLKRFPLEAGVPPNFSELADLEQREFIDRAKDMVFERYPDRALTYLREAQLNLLDKNFANHMANFRELDAQALAKSFGAIAPSLDKSISELVDFFEAFDAYAESEFNKTEFEQWLEAREAYQRGDVRATCDGIANALFTNDGAPKTFFAKPKAKMQIFNSLADGLVENIEAYHGANFWHKQAIIHEFGARLNEAYCELKQSHGKLDYNDMIKKCAALLNTQGRLNWVMYRLDGGIQHILVDEAQDTNPEQWSIIDALVAQLPQNPEEHRTVFVVGDYKQSIFGFQGADSSVFLRKKTEYSALFEGHKNPLHIGEMNTSFRSSPVILDFVDRVFDGVIGRGVGQNIQHIAANETLSGEVELWPYQLVEAPKKKSLWPDALILPVENSEISIAREIAARIAKEIADGKLIEDEGEVRPVRPGDYLILTRDRNKIYAPVQKELQKLGVPIAGVDVMVLQNELAVKDIMAALRYAHAPFDMFSLACFLKSPLGGLDDKALFALRQQGGDLWDALEASGQYARPLEMLRYLRENAYKMRPYDLISSFLIRFDGVDILRARLGPSVIDAVQMLLDAALSFESEAPASLAGFIAWFDRGDQKFKREFEEGLNAVRVLSMHGAKGLERPIVILPMMDKSEKAEPLKDFGDGPLYVTKTLSTSEISDQKSAQDVAKHDEERRLIYVALTRARTRLILVCAGGEPKVKNADDVFSPSQLYGEFERAILETKGQLLKSDLGLKRVFGSIDERQGAHTKRSVASKAYSLPELPKNAPKTRHALSQTLPQLDEKHEPNGRGADYGTLVHHILENWREAHKHEVPRAFFDRDLPDFEQAFAEASAVYERFHELLEHAIFEVPIAFDLGGQKLRGRIDAIVKEGQTIRLIDFKTNVKTSRDFAELDRIYQHQLAAYYSAMKKVYPDHIIEAEIIWTQTGARLCAGEAELGNALQAFTAHLLNL